jgi:hypothetical protein
LFPIFYFGSSNWFGKNHRNLKMQRARMSAAQRAHLCMMAPHNPGRCPATHHVDGNSADRCPVEPSRLSPTHALLLCGEVIPFPSLLALHTARMPTPLLCSSSSAHTAECRPGPMPVSRVPKSSDASVSTPLALSLSLSVSAGSSPAPPPGSRAMSAATTLPSHCHQ